MGATSFQHFWDDAIQGDTDEQHHVSVLRRKVLLGLASCYRDGTLATESAISKAARRYDVDERTSEDVLRGLRERNILVAGDAGELRCRVPLFGRWLVEEGVKEIVVTLGDDDVLIKRQRAQEALRPRDSELSDLVDKWKIYAGQVIELHKIREWLNQFGRPSNQRLMLQLLNSVHYFTSSEIGIRLEEAHSWLLRLLASTGYEYTLRGRQRTRNDILVCGLEGGGSGAAHLVKRYRDHNSIFSSCAVDASDVPNKLEGVRAVVVLDDFVATGGTARTRLRSLHAEWTADERWREDIDVVFLAVCAFDAGLAEARAAAERLDWKFHAHAAVLLDEKDRCFSPTSLIFPDETQREVARAISLERGDLLEPKQPLGYGNSEAAVCFEYRCPNNSLPILWKVSPNWVPLFPRG
jgi:hypothetical protein